MKKRIVGPIIIIFLIGSVVGLVKINKWIQGEVGDIGKISEHEVIVTPVPIKKKAPPQPKKLTGEVIKKTRMAPERSFLLSIFYQDGIEIARQKESRRGMVYDLTGTIPNGKVKFINETDKTYGVEYYRDNVKSGPVRTNYNDGKLKSEANYLYGKLMDLMEYYHDGVLKMEVDYTDARDFKDNRDVGVGKMYTREGMVKYEWYIVNSYPEGYHKTYNRNGSVKSTTYFDEFGNKIPPRQEVSVKSTTPPAVIIPVAQ